MSYIKQTIAFPYSGQPNRAFVNQGSFEMELAKTAANFIASLSEAARKSFNGRLERGLELAKAGCVEASNDPEHPRCYRVRSIEGDHQYEVNLAQKKCDCPDSQQGHTCKHRVAAYYFEQVMTKTSKVQDTQAELNKQVPTPKLATMSRTDQILSELGYSAAPAVTPSSAPKLGTLTRRFLHGQDLAGNEYLVTISSISKELVIPHPSQAPVEKWCLWVEGLPPGMPSGILFGTRGEEDLVAIFGNVGIETLAGNKLVIYPKAMTVAGQLKASIRFQRAK